MHLLINIIDFYKMHGALVSRHSFMPISPVTLEREPPVCSTGVLISPSTSWCVLFDGENISFDASLVTYIYIVLIFLQL